MTRRRLITFDVPCRCFCRPTTLSHLQQISLFRAPYLPLLLAAGLFFPGCDSTPGPAPLNVHPPVLEEFSFTPRRVVFALLEPAQIVGDSVQIPLTIQAAVRTGEAPVDKVHFVVQPQESAADPVATGILPPTGGSGYAGTLELTLSALDVTTYTVMVFAVDQAGQVSGEARGTLEFVRVFEPGSPPVVDELIIPDSLQRPAAGSPARSLSFVARVSDPDGLQDVVRVEFWNNTAPGTRIIMCDDGGLRACGSSEESGDAAAQDGLFTRRVFVSSSNALGANTLVFEAIDRAGLRSTTVSHTIVIYD